ncbi:MAG: RdgB/HAM1 family non-canonical purine NTP pyrophosphatase [Pseudomonadota bacterium]
MSRKLTPGKLVIASHNAGKLREIAALLSPYGMEPIGAADLGLPEPEETGVTFAENALLKARAAAGAGYPALADDSGLEVAALSGRPGVYTADWAERQAFEGDAGRDWYMAMGKVEGLLAQQGPDVDRSAAFVCTLALVWPDGEELVVEGRVEGGLIWPPRGAMGFGYDPVFVPAGSAQTFAEIAPEAKHAISHRADAFAKLVREVF